MIRTLVCAMATAIAVLTTGCATVSGSPNQTVSILTKNQKGEDVSEAKCELNNDKGRWYLTTPGSTMVQRSNEDMKIVCEKAGHDTGRKNVVSEVKGSMYGNIILGGGIGAIIDHSNGSAYEYPSIVHIDMALLTPEEIAARAAKVAAEKAAREAAMAAAAAERAANASRTMVPLVIATGRKPQKGDEWEYLASDKLFGKQKKLIWRVASIDGGNVVEELLVDGAMSHNWAFNGQADAIGVPIEMGFLFGQHWDTQTRIPELKVRGELGDCVRTMHCVIEGKVTGMERITIAAGTFDAIRIDGDLIYKHIAIQPRGRISVWYSEKDRRLLKQVASMRTDSRRFDETVELQAARTYQ